MDVAVLKKEMFLGQLYWAWLKMHKSSDARDDVVLNYERRKCRHRTTKVSRGSAAGATTIEVCATGLTWTKIGASALIKLEETFHVETVRNDDKCFFS